MFVKTCCRERVFSVHNFHTMPAAGMSPELARLVLSLEEVKNHRICLSCWLGVLKKYLTEFLGSEFGVV